MGAIPLFVQPPENISFANGAWGLEEISRTLPFIFVFDILCSWTVESISWTYSGKLG